MRNGITSPTFTSQDPNTSVAIPPTPLTLAPPTVPAPLAPLESLAQPAPPTLSISLATPTVPAQLAGPAPLPLAHTAPLAPPAPLAQLAPSTLLNLPIVSHAKGVIQKETQRQRIQKIGFRLHELQKKALNSGGQIPSPDLSNMPIEQFAPPGDAQLFLTPIERFSVPDLTGDADSLYGRIQWSMEKNPPLSLSARQEHANYLNLRFKEVTAEAQQLRIRNNGKET